jgi:hypothetical protein
MNSKEYRELIQAYQNIYEQQIGVPLDKPTDGAAARKLQQMIPKGEKIYIPKSGLQKAHYEPEGEELSENPLASLDKLARGTAQTVGGTIGGIQGQKTGIPGGRIVGGLLGRQKGGQMYDKAKETVGGLLKQSYESEGDLVDGQQDLFDIVKDYLLDEGYVTTEEEALYMMSNMSEETIQDIIEAAVQPSLITSKGKAQNFTKPNRVPFTSSTPVPTRSTTQATPPNRPSGGFGSKPSGQLKLDLNKPAATSQRSQQFRDVQRLTSRTGGGLIGTTKPTNLEPRAPKPAWKPTTSTTKPTIKPATTKTTAKPNTYRPAATGPSMDKFPQLQRFANQARKVAEPVSKVVGAVAALRNITPAGVAASVMAPKPTADGTLTAALKRGDYKPKQGPANPDQGLTKSQSFDKAFAAARKSNKTGFTWNNKTYNTKIKESVDNFDMIQDYLISEGYANNEKEALVIMVNISTEQIQNIKEDLEERRKQLMQRQRQQVTASQERVASHQQARKKRIRQQVTASRERAASNEQEKIEKHQRAQEKEQIKNELRNELKKEMRHEAVGDPISPNSVFKLTDKEVQKNLQSTMKPAGPAPMKPTSPKPKQQSSSDRFVKRIVGSTMLSPL